MSLHAVFSRPVYWNFIRSEAALIQTDGCSHVSGFQVDFCYEHDLSFFHGKDPIDAYYRFRGGALDPWKEAKPITFDEANKRFRNRHQANSKFGRLSPMAWWRWLGVQYGGRSAWEKHRERERHAVV